MDMEPQNVTALSVVAIGCVVLWILFKLIWGKPKSNNLEAIEIVANADFKAHVGDSISSLEKRVKELEDRDE